MQIAVVFTSTAMGVGKRLARLTSKSVSTGKRQLNQIYPDHASVLEKAGLALEEFPTLDKILEEDDKTCAVENTRKKKHSDRRNTFCDWF